MRLLSAACADTQDEFYYSCRCGHQEIRILSSQEPAGHHKRKDHVDAMVISLPARRRPINGNTATSMAVPLSGS
jgi:hypothetical protein